MLKKAYCFIPYDVFLEFIFMQTFKIKVYLNNNNIINKISVDWPNLNEFSLNHVLIRCSLCVHACKRACVCTLVTYTLFINNLHGMINPPVKSCGSFSNEKFFFI